MCSPDRFFSFQKLGVFQGNWESIPKIMVCVRTGNLVMSGLKAYCLYRPDMCPVIFQRPSVDLEIVEHLQFLFGFYLVS